MVEGEIEDLVEQELIFDCFASICMSLYTSLYGPVTASVVLTFQEPIHEVVSLERNYQVRYPPSGDTCFRALAVRWDLPMTASESSSSGY
jgi:hypothetical protein